MTSILQPSQLSGVQLESFLDQLNAHIQEQENAGLAENLIQENCLALLSNHEFEPQNRMHIANLFRAWKKAGQLDKALEVLEKNGPIVLAQSAKDEQEELQVALYFWQYEVLFLKPHHAELLAQLQTIRQQLENFLKQVEEPDQWGNAWSHLISLAQTEEDYEQVKRITCHEHELILAHPERQAYRAWDGAVFNLKMASYEKILSNNNLANDHAHKAFKSLAEKAPDQDVNHGDWLNLAETIVSYAPELLGKVVEQIRALEAADLPLPKVKQNNILIARVVAKAYYAQGQLQQAIEKAFDGRFSTKIDRDDSWTSLLMDWLVQDQQFDKAADLAFESLLFGRDGSSQKALELAQIYSQEPAQEALSKPVRVTWLACMALAAYCEEVEDFFESIDKVQWVQEYLNKANAQLAQHTCTDIIKVKLLMAEQQWHKALEILEKLVLIPAFAEPDLISELMQCRVMVHGADQAFELDLPQCWCGSWCYSIALSLADEINKILPNDDVINNDIEAELEHHYYAMGQERFEAFFNGAPGFYRDGDIHNYSMLCNNLAIDWRYRLDEPVKALILHHKGIQASSFAEHFDGILKCFNAEESPEKYVEAAENLWNYATTHGYGRHDPTDYIAKTAKALNSLDRDPEIAIWIERLDEWWGQQDDDDNAENHDSYIECLVNSLMQLSDTQKDDAIVRFNTINQNLPSIRNSFFWCNVADLYQCAADSAQAQKYYSYVLEHFPNDTTNRTYCQTKLKEIKVSLQAAKPWWKIW